MRDCPALQDVRAARRRLAFSPPGSRIRVVGAIESTGRPLVDAMAGRVGGSACARRALERDPSGHAARRHESVRRVAGRGGRSGKSRAEERVGGADARACAPEGAGSTACARWSAAIPSRVRFVRRDERDRRSRPSRPRGPTVTIDLSRGLAAARAVRASIDPCFERRFYVIGCDPQPGRPRAGRVVFSDTRRSSDMGAGKPSPFRAPSNAHGCPRMPVCSRPNFVPLFAIRCATITSCWRRQRSLNQ